MIDLVFSDSGEFPVIFIGDRFWIFIRKNFKFI